MIWIITIMLQHQTGRLYSYPTAIYTHALILANTLLFIRRLAPAGTFANPLANFSRARHYASVPEVIKLRIGRIKL